MIPCPVASTTAQLRLLETFRQAPYMVCCVLGTFSYPQAKVLYLLNICLVSIMLGPSLTFTSAIAGGGRKQTRWGLLLTRLKQGELMDLDLAGKRVIVTGGSRGIGKAIIDQFVREGASVATCARGETALLEAVNAWQSQGTKAYGEALDVGDKQAFTQWLRHSVDFLGGLDIYISNVSTRLTSEGETRWYDAFETDFIQHVRGAEAVIPHLQQSTAPAFVFVSSIASVMANIPAMEQEYGVMKAALNGYSAQLAHRLAEHGIRSNVVTPGPVTFAGGFWDSIRKAQPEFFDRVAKLPALQRHGTPEEVANAVVFLASPAAAYITGANLRVDGGALKHVHN